MEGADTTVVEPAWQDVLEPAGAGARRPPGVRRLLVLAATALGIVYGDIGTSPLYAVRQCFHLEGGLEPSPVNIFGVLSLIIWALLISISLKYLVYVMRADNRGEGGILVLMSLARGPRPGASRTGRWREVIIALGLFGAALLYGDGTITPAISVLSAIEGLEIAAPALTAYVLPLAVAVLLALFAFQRHGTSRVGAVFGPFMIVWFVVIGLLGLLAVLRHVQILGALNPWHGVRFFAVNGWHGLVVLGSVFLAVTGGEALYADMGHFGKAPIRLAWFTVVLPALVLNYLGQGALLLVQPSSRTNPFYLLAPSWATYPLIALATGATVIASQAIISGAFSLTRQAIQLGYSPRMRIEHTSPAEIGQIYMPAVNATLMIVTIALVFGFRQSSRLAAAYGVAVATTMVITTLLAFPVARWRWRWGLLPALGITAFFLGPDLSFFAANMTKVKEGGWFPLLVAGVIYLLLSTWERGRTILAARLSISQKPLDTFLEELRAAPPLRTKGSAVFLSGTMAGTPMALTQHLKHSRALHETVLLLTITTRDVPHVALADRVQLRELGNGFYRVIATYGFMEEPNLVETLEACRALGLALDPEETSFYVSRSILVPTGRGEMAGWRDRLFALLARNAQLPTAFFHIPSDRVVDLEVEIEL